MKDRYEVHQHGWNNYLIKDVKEKRWIGSTESKKDADHICFVLNEFEKSKIGLAITEVGLMPLIK